MRVFLVSGKTATTTGPPVSTSARESGGDTAAAFGLAGGLKQRRIDGIVGKIDADQTAAALKGFDEGDRKIACPVARLTPGLSAAVSSRN